MPKNNIQLKILGKIFDAGYCTEKEISALTLDEILKIPSITVPEISHINDLQKAVKANKVLSFLSGASSERDGE